MRVKLHCLSNDICNLVEAAVIHPLHSVQNTALNRLKAICYMGNGTVQYNIRGIVQEPVLEHSGELIFILTILNEFVIFAAPLFGFQNI